MTGYLRGTMGVTAPLNEVSTEHIREVMGHLLKNRSPATASVFLAAFKRFFKWMLAEGERRDDPSERIKQPKVPMKKTETLSRADIKALLAACQRDKTKRGFRDTAVLLVLLDTGLRANELCAARIADLDLNGRALAVIGKGSRPRTVGLSARTAVAIDRYLRKARAGAR